MVTLHKFISAFFTLALLTQCNDKKVDATNTEIKIDFGLPGLTLPHSTLYHPTSYEGKWSYSFPFYSSELCINKDGTFKFHEQGCTGHGYSEGKWTNRGTSILLTSFEKYSANKPMEVVEVKSTAKSSTLKKKKVKDKIDYTFDPSIFNTSSTYKFSASDTLNVYFDNVQIRLEGDTLYRLNKDGFPTDTKFVLTKNNR